MPSPDGDAMRPLTSMRWAVRALAVGLFVVIVGMVGYSLASLVLPGAALMPDHPSLVDFLAFSLIFIAFPAVGLVVSWKRPENPIGWIFLAIGFGIVASVFAAEYAGRVIYVGWVHPAVELVAWIGGWIWFVATGLALTFAVLLFPDGRLPGTRWRPVAWLAAIAIGVSTLYGLAPSRASEACSPILSGWAARWETWRAPSLTWGSWQSCWSAFCRSRCSLFASGERAAWSASSSRGSSTRWPSF